MSFRLYVSTSLEKLAGIFREEIYESEEIKNPLHPIEVAVQTQGIATWLKQYIASESTIAMNLKMPFLKSAIAQTIKEYYPASEEDLTKHSLDRDTWEIFHYLSGTHNDDKIPELETYLQNDPDMRKRYQISRQIAAAFEQYRTYRQEDMVQKWRDNKGTPQHWQEKIFRDIFVSDYTLDRYISHFIREAEKFNGEQVKKCLSVFGISSMPPMFLEFFKALSKYQDVVLFYLAPSKDYWDNAKKNQPEDSGNNPLLQALGIQGRAFFEELLSKETWNTAHEKNSDRTGEKTFLSCLQEDIRNNRNVSETCAPDGTILIENCHTPLREVEVLHDRLLQEIKNGKKPGEILVTAPNIEKYVPYIENIFGTGPLAGYYTIADRTLKDAGTILPALLQILHLPDSSYSNSDIFSLLETEALQKKFHLENHDVRQIRSWCTASGIRWGVDGDHREQKCGVNFEDFSWRQGIRRLLMGYAVGENAGEQDDLQDIPLDFAEGAGAEKFGYFLDFLDELFRLRDELSQMRTPREWFELLKEFPDKFFQPEDFDAVEERSALIRFLTEQAYESAPCKEPVTFSVIRDILERAELSGNSASAFLRGKITFCSMVPMRTIPMSVIAILGLNAGEFPRRDTAAGFNLIAKDVKLTDRSRNLEDRYLLLETLLAAKEKLFIYYNGQSAKDNSEIFPTPPLAELIQYLERLSGAENEKKKYLVKHRIQAHSESYFDGSDPLKFSYSDSAFLAAASSCKNTIKTESDETEIPIFFPEELGDYTLPERLSISELNKFFQSPSEFYLSQQKIGNFKEFNRENIENEELFHPDPLTASIIKKEMVRYAADWFRKHDNNKTDYKYLQQVLSKKAQLPCREVGVELFANYSLEMQKILADSFLQAYTNQTEELIEVKCSDESGHETIFSGLVSVSEDHTKSCCFQASEKKPKHRLKLWLNHLLLSAKYPEYTEMVCQFEDQEFTLQSVSQNAAQKKLLQLAAIREAGKNAVIPFFDEIEPVECIPNARSHKYPYQLKGYQEELVKVICFYDYCASLLFKKSDLDEEFLKKVCMTVSNVYKVEENTNE